MSINPFYLHGEELSPVRKLLFMKALAGGAPLSEYEATGNPLTFETNVAKPLKSLVASFLPVQSGSGDPSPTNVRSISGWSGVNVWHTGKNLFDSEFENGNVNAIDGSIARYETTTNRIISGFVELLPGTYSISCKEGKQSSIYFYESADESTYIYSERLSSWINNPRNFTLANKRCAIIVLRNSDNSNISPSDVTEFQLEVGETATAYSPYVGESYPVTFPAEPGTVYGGSVDLVTGVLTAEWAKIALNGSEANWSNYNQGTAFSISITGMKNVASKQVICDRFKQINNITSFGVYAYAKNNYAYFINATDISGVSDIESWKAYLAENPMDFAYELATPVTYQLTPSQISALIGDNTIWSDANSDCEVTYLKKG